MKVPVSVVIPIRNEEVNLPACLRGIAWADEIFVVDSESTDRSTEIAGAAGARVVQFHYQAGGPKKKNWSLDNLPFTHEWVFFLDADEVLPMEAEEEFRGIVTSATSLDGYWINRRFQFLGRWMRHAYYPNWNLRLFRRKSGRFEKVTSSETESGDVEIHEHVLIKGPTGKLRSEMDHYAFPTVAAFVEKHNRYSNWEAAVARDRMLAGSSARLGNAEVAWRRTLKQWSQRLPCRPALRFLYVYLWQRGFMDGWEGYYFARLHALYEFLCVAKTYELTKDKTAGNHPGERP